MISDNDVHSTDVLYHHHYIVCTPLPFLQVESWASNQIFKKGGAWQDLNF